MSTFFARSKKSVVLAAVASILLSLMAGCASAGTPGRKVARQEGTHGVLLMSAPNDNLVVKGDTVNWCDPYNTHATKEGDGSVHVELLRSMEETGSGNETVSLKNLYNGKKLSAPEAGASSQQSPVYDIQDYDKITQGKQYLKFLAVSSTHLPGDDFNYTNELRIAFKSGENYVFQAGDTLEYDVFCYGDTVNTGIVDIITTDYLSLMEDSGAADQNGLPLGVLKDRTATFNMNAYASNCWYHRTVKIPNSFIGKTAAEWTINAINMPENAEYAVLFDNIILTNGGKTQVTAYAEGKIEKSWRLKQDPHLEYSLEPSLIFQQDVKAFGEGIRIQGTTNKLSEGQRATAQYTFSTAGKGQYALKAGDFIYYKVKNLTPFIDGTGAIDIVFTDGSKLSDYQVLDNNNYAILATNDLSSISYKTWLYRKIDVKGNLIGKMIDHWIIPIDTSASEKKIDVIYSDVKIVNDQQTEVLAYGGGNLDAVKQDSVQNMTASVQHNDLVDDLGLPDREILCLKGMPTYDNDQFTPTKNYDTTRTVGYAISDTPVTIGKNYYLEYDIKYATEVPGASGFGVELANAEGIPFDFSSVTDQNGMSALPATNLSRYASAGWYHRRINLDFLAGQTIDKLNVVYRTPYLATGAAAYFDNIKIVRDDILVLMAYKNQQYKMVDYLVPHNGIYAGILTSMPYTADKPQDNIYQVADFGAAADGKTDDTQAVQAALFTAQRNGGGTVQVPAGEYLLKSHLLVPDGVTLQGSGDTTVFLAIEGHDHSHGTALITVEGTGSLTQFAVFYPNQTSDCITPYPYTIRNEHGKNSKFTDLTLYNSFDGMKLGTTASSGQQITNVKMTALRHGLSAADNDNTVISGFTVSPDIWMNSQYWTAGEAAKADMKFGISDQLEAICIGSSRNISITDLTVSYAKTGLFMAEGTQVSSWTPQRKTVPKAANGTIKNIQMDHVGLGIQADYISGDITVDGGSISADGGFFPLVMRLAKDVGHQYDASSPAGKHITLKNVTMDSTGGCVEIISAFCETIFDHCHFTNWNSDYYCIDMSHGVISGSGTTFGRTDDQVMLRNPDAQNNLSK